MSNQLDHVTTADLAAELKRRERAEAMRKHRDAFPIAAAPVFGPTRETLREIHIEERLAARRAERAAAAAQIGRLPIWDLPGFDAVATGDSEHDGRSRADDIDKLTALEFAATQYAPGLAGPSGRPSLKLRAAQALNASRMIGEADKNGDWQPTTHTETRRDGSTFKRYVTEQMHHVSDLHQLDGGDRVIVAVEVGSGYHVIQARKRWLNMAAESSVSLFGKIYPNRKIPRTGRRFFYEPMSYIRTEHAEEADDLAWRWAAEDRLTEDDNEQHALVDDIGSDFLKPTNRVEGESLTPRLAKLYDEAIARAPQA